MSKTGDEYELFIRNLITNIQKNHHNIKCLGSGSKNTIEGHCGQKHQIDVSFIDHSCPNPTLILIECKQRSRFRIPLADVKVMKATLDDILARPDTPEHISAIIITTKGAQKGAQKFAKFYGIEIQTVPYGREYTFSYQNIIQAGVVASSMTSASASAFSQRKCKSCGVFFKPRRTELDCPQCDKEMCD